MSKRLAVWMTEERLEASQLQEMIGRSNTYTYNIIKGKIIPHHTTVSTIMSISRGQVTPNDLYEEFWHYHNRTEHEAPHTDLEAVRQKIASNMQGVATVVDRMDSGLETARMLKSGGVLPHNIRIYLEGHNYTGAEIATILAEIEK